MKVWLLTLAIALVTAVLLAAGASHDTPADAFGLSGPGGAAFLLASLAFATVGALIAARVPGNAIGPAFRLIGLTLAAGVLTFQYADRALFIAPDALPGGPAAAWLQNFGLPSGFGLLAVAVLLFPDGRPPAPRWRWVLVLAVGGIVCNALGYGLRPGPLDAPFEATANPLGLEGALTVTEVLTVFGWLAMGAAVGLAALGRGLRLRRARGVERAQLMWLALAAAVTGVAVVAVVVSYFLPVTGFAGIRSAVLGIAFAVFPLAAGVAILRHRLYDIEVVVNRALVYGALTAVLAGAYAAAALVVGLAVGESDVAIAVSTLAVAALFGPARARIQAAVDRRFYRRRYDAARTLEAFGARLRDEVDLDALAGELRAAASDTVQPAHVSLWLRR